MRNEMTRRQVEYTNEQLNKPLDVIVDSSGLLLTDELKMQIMEAMQNNKQFVLHDEDNICYYVFGGTWVGTYSEGGLTLSETLTEQQLKKFISLAVVNCREFKLLNKYLSFSDVTKINALANLKLKQLL